MKIETSLPKKLLNDFVQTRGHTLEIVEPLETEDFVLQCMEDASPPKWHLAHTTWFFEEFILRKFVSSYQDFDADFNFIFNSYYNSIGKMHKRSERGFLSRPTVKSILQYRSHVDNAIAALWDTRDGLVNSQAKEVARLIKIGINHEQQHQELMLTDIKYNFYKSPLKPVYNNRFIEAVAATKNSILSNENSWSNFDGGLIDIGTNDDDAFDNERPQHRKFVEKFAMANRLVSNGEFLKFIEAGGYQRSELWLSEAWSLLQKENWQWPLYWQKQGNEFYEFRLDGLQKLQVHEPVMHISFYEADAYARFKEARLPFEEEWEFVARNPSDDMQSLYGDCWQWTVSSYLPYPGFRAETGALGEYNGKFMCGQKVLRGSSLYTSTNHSSPTYRNFFPVLTRWQRTGIRLVKD